MNIQELGEQYQEKTDEELLRLALNGEQLTREANLAFTGELARRGIASQARLDVAQKDEQERKAESERSLGTLGVFHLFGAGRIRLGNADRVRNLPLQFRQRRPGIPGVLSLPAGREKLLLHPRRREYASSTPEIVSVRLGSDHLSFAE
jgi:hypothetical protein